MDIKKNELKIRLVGDLKQENEFRLWGFDKGLGWVPHFNLYRKGTELRIARIPIEWFGEKNEELVFE